MIPKGWDAFGDWGNLLRLEQGNYAESYDAFGGCQLFAGVENGC